MISLTLCGNEELTMILRWLTVITLLLLTKDFMDLLIKRYRNLDSLYPENEAKVKFERILRAAMDNHEFGDEYHLLAVSTFLSRDIFIYSYFTKDDCLLLPRHLSSSQLLHEFKKKSNKIGHHLKYEPIQNKYFIKTIEQSLNGFFTATGDHYTALILQRFHLSQTNIC